MDRIAQIFGQVNPPPGVSPDVGGLPTFINAVLKFLIVIAGIYALFNFVLAGYGFMSASDDPKKVAAAWAKIWQTIIGLAVAAGAFVIAAIVSWLIFGDPNAILQFRIFSP
jgi:hypothetical protein